MMENQPKIFISYCSKNSALAQRLKDDLSHSGCDSWQFDLSAVPGTDAWNTILERIEKSDFFLVIVSAASAASKGVQEEVSHAHYCSINDPNGRPRIIPLIIEKPVTVPRQIVRAVRLEFRETHYNSDFEQLLTSLGLTRSPFADATELDVTFTRGREFDAKRETSLYAESLIRNNSGVAAQFESLSEDVRRQAGGKWQLPSAQTIEWRGETWRDSVQPQWTRKSQYTFIVIFALHFNYHTGYIAEKRVVVEVSAFQLIKYDHAGEELVFHSDTLQLKFDGFRNISLAD